MFGLKLNKNRTNLRSLAVVGHGSETTLQAGENLNKIPWREKGKFIHPQELFPLLKTWKPDICNNVVPNVEIYLQLIFNLIWQTAIFLYDLTNS